MLILYHTVIVTKKKKIKLNLKAESRKQKS